MIIAKSVSFLSKAFLILQKYKLCIEVDGPQHYEWIPGMMTQEAFSDLQEHDRRKAVYCASRGLQLIRVKISDFDGFLG